MISLLTAQSSTTSTCKPFISGGVISFLCCCVICRPKRTVKLKTLPFPTSLSTQMLPSSILTSCLQIHNPSPVPSYFRVVDASAWQKGLKSLGRCSGAIPTPVSCTKNFSIVWSNDSFNTFTPTRITPPLSVNLIALSTRFFRIC